MRFQVSPRAKTRKIPDASMLAVAVGLLALGGCGSSSKSTSSSAAAPASAPAPATTASTPASTPAPATGAASVLKLETNPEGALKFDMTSLTVKAGKVSIGYTNASPLAHNLTVASPTGAVLGATPTFTGGSKTLSLTLKPGTYKFYCSVPGHRQSGMEGTLTVQ